MQAALAVPRNILFYLVFYGGTALFAAASSITLTVVPSRGARVVRGWAGFHRVCARWLLGIRLVVHGSPPTGPALIALKHQSFFEAIDLPLLLPHPVVFAKAALLRLPVWGGAARRYGMVSVERDQGAKALRAMISDAKALTRNGRPLAIFPEGTRVPVGARPPLQAGFAGLYKLIGLPVVPVAVDSGRLYNRTWKRPGTVTIAFGEPIPPGLPREEVEIRVHEAINTLNVGS